MMKTADHDTVTYSRILGYYVVNARYLGPNLSFHRPTDPVPFLNSGVADGLRPGRCCLAAARTGRNEIAVILTVRSPTKSKMWSELSRTIADRAMESFRLISLTILSSGLGAHHRPINA